MITASDQHKSKAAAFEIMRKAFRIQIEASQLNTCMYRYQVYVKVKGSMVKTIIFADNDIHARLLAQYQYGMNNVSIPPQRIGN